MIKLVAIDVYGTLLDSQNRLSKSNKEAIKRCTAMGIKVVICTGRPLTGVMDILTELNLDGKEDYVISFNGSLIQNAHSKQIIDRINLFYKDSFTIEKLRKYLEIGMHVQSDNGIYSTDQTISQYTQFDATLNMAEIHQITSEEMSAISTNKVMFVDRPYCLDQKIKMIPKLYKTDYQFMRSWDCFVEYLHPMSGKGNALKILADKSNILPREIAAIVDNDNDISMLDFAEFPIAMKNASSKFKKHAKYITLSNGQDGVSNALNKMTV